MKKILVIGGAGYLGSHVASQLLDKPYDVRIFDNFSVGKQSLKLFGNKNNVEIINGDIRNTKSLRKAISGVDAIVHLAGIVGDEACNVDRDQTHQINYEATKTIVDMAIDFGIQKFIFASTCSVYGKSNNIVLDESSSPNPLSLYADLKLKSEQIILKQQSVLKPIIYRTSTLFGYSSRMRFDLVINNFICQAMTKKRINLNGGDQYRPFIHVKDAARAYVLALEESFSQTDGIFNLGADSLNYKIEDIANLVKNSTSGTRIMKTEINDHRDYKVNFEKIKNVLGFEPKMSIQDGIDGIMNNFSFSKNDYNCDSYYNLKLAKNGSSFRYLSSVLPHNISM